MKLTCIGTGSKGNSWLVQTENNNILLDAGVKPSKIRDVTNLQITDIDYVLLSHEHKDHSKYAKELCEIYGVYVLCSEGTAKKIKPKKRYNTHWNGWDLVNGDTISRFDVTHDALEPIGFKLTADNKTLIYIPDTGEVPNIDLKTQTDKTVVLCEANYTEKKLFENADNERVDMTVASRVYLRQGHLSLEQVVEYFKDKKDIELVLHHMSNLNFDKQAAQKLIEQLDCPVEIAHEGFCKYI